MDGFHLQSVADYESDPLPAAQIGDPVAGEDSLHRHDEVFLVGGYGSQESIGIRMVVPVQEKFTGMIYDAEKHRSCV